MADYSDGSMIVDTEIDTEGFLKDSEKLKRAIASLSKQVDSIGQQMKTAIAKNNTAAMEVLNQKFAESQNQAEALRKKMEGFSSVKILSDDYIKITDEAAKAEAAMQRLIERQEKLKALGADKASTQWQNTQKAIEETTAKLEDYKKRLAEAKEDLAFMNTPEQRAEAHAEGPEGWAMYTEELARLKQQIIEDQSQADKLAQALAKLTARREQLKASGADQGSRQYQSLLYDMEQLRAKQEELNAAKEKMESDGTAFKMGSTTQEFEQLNQQMSETEQHMEQVEQAKERAFSAPSVSGLPNFLSNVARRALNAAVNLAKMVGNGALSYLRKLAAGAKNAAIQLMKLAGRAISSGIQRIGTLAANAGKSLLGLGKNAKQSSGGLNVGLKALLRYGLGIRSVFVLLNKIRSAVKEAFNNMAKKVPEANQSLSRLASSLDRLKNSLATAFQPILTAIAPYLTQFMDMISNALTKVGEFFAALTGQKYVYKATKAQIDYAKSLDKTAKSAKEAKNQLADFDNLHILSDNSSDNSDSSNTETPTSDFEKVPIESDIADFIQRIKNAFKNGDFRGIGEIIADKINGIFTKLDELISWENIGAKITRIVTAITDGINGFVDRLDWEKIGRTIGSGINTVVNTLYLLFTQIDWEKIGKGLARGLNSLVSRVDWEKLGRLFGARLNVLIKTIHGFVTNFNWGEAGQAFAKTVLGLVDEVDWQLLIQDIIDSINGVITILQEFVGYFEWGSYGTDFANGVNKLVDEVDWDGLGGLLADSIGQALTFLYNAVSNLEWGNAGVKFSNALNAFFVKKENWALAGETIDKSIKGLLDFTKNAVITFDEVQFAEDVKALFENVDWPGIAAETWDLIKTMFSKAGNFLDVLMNEDVDSARSIDEAYERLMFNKQSFGTKLGAKLAEAIRSVPWEEVGSALSKLAQRIFDTITDFFTELTKAGQNGKSPIEDAVDNFMKGVDWDALKESFVRAAEATFKAIGQSLGRIILNGIFGVLSDEEMEEGHQKVLDQAEERADKTGVSLSSAYLQVGESVADSYYAGMKDRAENTDDVAPVFESALDVILNAADPETKGKSEAEQFYSGFKNTVLDDQGEVKSQFESVLNEIFLPSELEALKNGELSADDFAQAFEEGTRTVGGDATQALTEFFNLVFNSQDMETPGKGLATDAVDGFTDELEGKESEVADAMKKALYDPFDEKVRGKEGFDAHSPSRTTEALGKDVVEGFTGGLEGQKDDADKRSKTLFEGLFKTIVATADAMHTFQTIILTALTNLEKHFPTRMDTYKTQFETGWNNINSVVATAMTTLQSTTLTGLTNLEKTIPPRFEKIGNSISNQNWWSVGDNIVAGIQRGIQNNWPWLENTVWHLAQSLYNTARNALGIHSPSTLFENGVGKMLGLGTAVGYEKSQPKILEAVSNVADAMVAEMNKADVTANLGVERGGITDDLDGVLSIFLDKVSDSFANLMDRLEAIADSVTFRMPAVATGSVVPYRVSAQSEGSTRAISDALTASTDEQTSAIIQGFNNQTIAIVRALEQYCTTQINLDKRSLTDAVIEEINRRTRMTNKSPLLI